MIALVLRPEPGNARTMARLAGAGIAARALPLFAIRPLAWEPPDPASYDALLLTSANAARHAGPALGGLRRLPAIAVGAATAAATADAGLAVAVTGTRGAAAAVATARARGLARLVHLAGRERVALPGVDAIPVYASDPLPIAPGAVAARGDAALLHSARAAARFAALASRDGLDRARWTLAAISPAVAAAAGEGWQRLAVAARPTDAAMIDLLRAG